MQFTEVFTLLLILRISEGHETLKLNWDGFINFHYGQKHHENQPTSQEQSSEDTNRRLILPGKSMEDTVILPIEEPSMDISDQFSPRVLFSADPDHPIDTSKPPVDLARIWLRELGLFQLQSQILQAKHMTTKKGTVLLELKTALQAIQVVDTLSHSPKEGLLKGLSANQTRIDFFNDFPKSEFD